jgi:hypothetical protein
MQSLSEVHQIYTKTPACINPLTCDVNGPRNILIEVCTLSTTLDFAIYTAMLGLAAYIIEIREVKLD